VADISTIQRYAAPVSGRGLLYHSSDFGNIYPYAREHIRHVGLYSVNFDTLPDTLDQLGYFVPV
jgi:hypothetical protein